MLDSNGAKQDIDLDFDGLEPILDVEILMDAPQGSDGPIVEEVGANMYEEVEEVPGGIAKAQVMPLGERGRPYPWLANPFARYNSQLLPVELTVILKWIVPSFSKVSLQEFGTFPLNFFGARSCEYSEYTGWHIKRRTGILGIGIGDG